MGKGIYSIHKYDQRNWPYTYPKTNFFIRQYSETYIKPQQVSASVASVGAHD